jgi:predicted nucleotidyltransferase
VKYEKKNNSRENVLEQVRNIVCKHLLDKPAQVYLFGSWARSEEKRSSDIDVAIEFHTEDQLNQITLMNIRDALEESTIPFKVDIVHLNAADDIIARKVRTEGILWRND